MSSLTRRTFLAAVSAAPAALESAAQIASAQAGNESQSADLKLWYEQPAAQWVDALPIGNGRLGAMVFGGGEHQDPAQELLQLNEETLWSGAPANGNNPDAKNHLAEVRSAVLDQQDYHRADEICHKMQGLFAEAYQPLGDLQLSFKHSGAITGYRRELDLDTACARVHYQSDETRFTRETFVSAPDQILILHVAADRPNQLHCAVSMRSLLAKSVEALPGQKLRLTGKAAAHVAGAGHPGSEKPITFSEEPGKGMYFVALAEVRATDGNVTANADTIEVNSATTLTILVSGVTGYRGFESAPDASIAEIDPRASRPLEAARNLSVEALRARHVRDYQSLFHRVTLNLGASPSAPSTPSLPTDQRLALFPQHPDPSLLALYFQYGRYLLISSSRPGTQPANLQGIWNERSAAALELQLDRQHQRPDELLAGRNLQPRRMRRAAVRPDRRSQQDRRRTAAK